MSPHHPRLTLEDGIRPAAGMKGSFYLLVLKGNGVKKHAAYDCDSGFHQISALGEEGVRLGMRGSFWLALKREAGESSGCSAGEESPTTR